MFHKKSVLSALILYAIFLYSSGTTTGAQNSPPIQGLANCPGAVIDSGRCEKYKIVNAIGDGLVVHETNLQVEQPKIIGASGDGISVSAAGGGVYLSNATVQNVAGNGIVIRGDSCMIDGGTINGARGVGLLVIGNRNTITNVKIMNCLQPIVIQGEGNIVSWTNSPRPNANDSVQMLNPSLQDSQNSNLDTSNSSTSVQGQIRSKQSNQEH